MITLYQLLGVSETAPMDEIEAAYKIKVANEKDEKRINQLRIASEILLDDQKRKKYDVDFSKLTKVDVWINNEIGKLSEISKDELMIKITSNQFVLTIGKDECMIKKEEKTNALK